MVSEGSSHQSLSNRYTCSSHSIVDKPCFDYGTWNVSGVSTDESSRPRVWIEKTQQEGREYKQAGDLALGRALIAPSKDKGGHRRYETLREADVGDIVLHLVQEQYQIVAASIIDSELQEDFEGPPDNDWNEEQRKEGGYRRNLRSKKGIEPHIHVYNDLLQNEDYTEQLQEIRSTTDKKIFYTKNLQLNQGHYFTPCPSELVEIFAAESPNLKTFLEEHGYAVNAELEPYSGISEATAAIREEFTSGESDNWLGNLLAIDVIKEWTAVLRRNSTVENDINPSDVHVYEQLYDLYSSNRERLQTEADRLNVQQIKNSGLTPAQVLFTVLIRDLQLQADLTPNFDHEKMSQLLDERFRQPPLEESNTPPAERETIARQFSRAKQLVFHGPPGTGKTYTAREFARWWLPTQSETATEAQLEVVTFHPSFTYEDFIEGLTARESNGGVEYAVEAGVFKQFCDRARRAYESHRDDDAEGSPPPHVLIIDEINRGNLAQIFGEIITLLEPDKRQDAVSETATTLPHSNERFTVPPNLYVIGTMNTADRSIALVDAALRRRFRFIHFPPSMTPLEQTYGFDGDVELETLATGGDAADSLLALSILAWKQLNARIRDATQLGRGKQLGHSYLLGIDRDANPTEQVAQLVDAWQFEILPLLEEYYFGQFVEIERQLFDGDAGELLDTDRQEIRAFTAGELATGLGELVGINVAWEAPTTGGDSFSNSLGYLAENGVLEVGDELRFDIDSLHENPEPKFEPDSDYWVSTIADLGAQKGVRWAYDGELHSLSELAQRIDHDHRDTDRTNYAGPTYWYIPGHEEYSLLELARAIQNGEPIPDQLDSAES